MIASVNVRDSAFTLLFKNEKYVVDLYSELTGKKLDPTKIRSVRLEDDVKKARLYNDVAFLTEDNHLLVLIEHQSTLNPNMAFRMLEYYVALAGKHIKGMGGNKYSSKQIQIPKAEFFVVYNGRGEMNDSPILDLGDVQVKAKVANIHYHNLKNHDHNNAVAAYARFVELAAQMNVNDALDKVLEEGFLTEFFGRKEYRDMFAEVFSYDQELFDSGKAQGLEQGLEQGVIIGAIQMLAAMDTPRETIQGLIREKYQLTEIEAMNYMEKYYIQ